MRAKVLTLILSFAVGFFVYSGAVAYTNSSAARDSAQVRPAGAVPKVTASQPQATGGKSQAASAQTPPADKETRVVDERHADVTGDGVADTVRLVGRNLAAGGFAGEHQILVTDGATGQRLSAELGDESGGFDQPLFLGDFDGDKVADILVSIPTGGSGGVVHYYLLTMAGSNPRYIVLPKAFLAGPRFKITFLDQFKVKVDNLDLGTSGTLQLPLKPGMNAMPDPYRTVYSTTGKLLRENDGVVDPYSAVEPLDLDHDGVYELVGYQQIWSLVHANTIGTARSIWRFSDGALKLTEVSVRSLYTPADYARDLAGLDVTRAGESVEKAVELYTQQMAGAPPVWRDEAFAQFREFHRQVQTQLDKALQVRLQGGAGMASLQEAVRSFNDSDTFRSAGVAAVYEGEGQWVVAPRQGFQEASFGALLTPTTREFVAKDDVEKNRPWAMDAAIVIPLTELGERVRDWDAYLATYPASPFRTEAQRYYRNELRGFAFGLDNTPLFDLKTKKVRPESLEALQRYAKENVGSQSANLVSQVLGALKKHNYKSDAGLRAELDALRNKALPLESPSGR